MAETAFVAIWLVVSLFVYIEMCIQDGNGTPETAVVAMAWPLLLLLIVAAIPVVLLGISYLKIRSWVVR